ncbi:sigma-70 family RNA polymerase sigma factor [Olsenella uli]|uniref:RNA polymerase sigma factor n=1 Tax=Olsenella uli TaxID=133926 RepID=UPI001956ED1F|nr:sigma-70 family RNA polymerase sigma factor [Olsenella uli]MBM6816546.1 sigma-70 family RNA polymerase sigma factor [Olsenella uli]
MGEKNARADEAGQLVGEHYADVLRYCRRHAPAGLAEDAAQETFLRFVRARSRYRERGRARAYLVTIARNVCADLARGRAAGWDELPETLPAGGDPGEKDDERDLASALARLPRAQREALELRYGEGLTVGEVGAALGMSRFAAGRALSAALKALRAELGAPTDGQGGLR